MPAVEDFVTLYAARHWDGLATCEAIVFRLDDEGLTKGMHLYLQQPGAEAPVGGRAAMGRMPD